MLKIENWEVVGWEHAIRGARNPMNSWEKSDSEWKSDYFEGPYAMENNFDPSTRWAYVLGPNDHDLLMRLRNAGTDHRKFMRFIVVYLDITAPLYWWKEFKTYRAGRKFGDPEPDIFDPELLEMDIETNSCSTMHKIHSEPITVHDFSFDSEVDQLTYYVGEYRERMDVDDLVVFACEELRQKYIKTGDKKYWRHLIQLLPSSYNQKRTVVLNYEVLANIYGARKNHKLDEWHVMCDWVKSLPYSELIIGDNK